MSTDALNENFSALETLSDTWLSRTGTSPNAMEADLDMNNNDILNATSIGTQALTVNGSNITSEDSAVSTLPSQAGNTGKFLSTNGAASSWNTVTTIDSYIGAVSDLVADTTLQIGNIVDTFGYTTEGDGGDNRYEVVAAGTGTADEGEFIDLPNTSPALQARGLFPGAIYNAKQWGALWDNATNDSSAVQAFVDFLGTTNSTGSWPAGIGRFSNIQISTSYHGLTILGQGKAQIITGTGTTTLVNNAATPMFEVAGSGTLPNFTLKHFNFRQLDSSSGEMLISAFSADAWDISSINYLLLNPSLTWVNIAAPSIARCTFEDHYGTGAAGFAASLFSIESQAPGSYFNNIFSDWFINSNNTAVAPVLRIRDLSGGSTNGANTLHSLVFELCANGGAIHASSIRNSTFSNIFCDDSSSNGKPLILLDRDVTPGSQESALNTFIGCVSGEGTAAFPDLKVETLGPGSQTVLINCTLDFVDVAGPPYTNLNSRISSDSSGQPPMVITSGVITVPENGNITFQEGMSVPEVQTGITGVILAGGNEVIVFDNTFSNIPKVVATHVGTSDKGGPAQQSAASTTGVTIYNHGTASSTIDWVAVAVH